MKRNALIAGGVIDVLLAGFFVLLSTIDVNQYKDVIEEQAAVATGRALTIEGDTDLSVSFSPAIVINGIRFQNAEWGSRPDMAVIERVEASVPLIPLIFGNISVTRLALVKPDISLESTITGQSIAADGTIGAISSLATMSGSFPIDLSLSLGELTFDTDLEIDFDGPRPKIASTITADVLDLTTLPPADDVPAPEKLFPSDPIPWDALASADADITVSVNRIVLKEDLAVTNANTKLTLENGRFSQAQTADFGGGKLSSEVALTVPGGDLSITAKADRISAESVAKDLNATDIITQGDIGWDVTLQGRGQSIAAMMASLNGSVLGAMGEARIRNEAINLAGADFAAQLLSNLNPFAVQEEFTVAECTVVNFQVQDGIARTEKGIAFATGGASLLAEGALERGAAADDACQAARTWHLAGN